jgi:predicted nucleic acid-binding protein
VTSVVDASVLVSCLLPQDAHHAASRAWLGRQLASGASLVAPITLLAEVGGAIARRTEGAEQGQQAIGWLIHLPNLRLAAVDHSVGLLAAELATALRLRGADALYVAVAERLALPLVSWDREQQERAVGRVPVQTPAA